MKYCYINAADVFFFSINNSMYSYNIITGKLTCIAEGLSREEYMVIPDSHSFVWEKHDESGMARQIAVLDMDTGSTITINAQDNEYIKLIGVIGSNVVYGTGREKDIGNTPEGNPIYALSDIEIIDKNGGIVKSYKKKGFYIVNAYVDDNVVYLERCKKRRGVYVRTSGDNIINRLPAVNKTVKLVSRVTKKALTEWYIDLPPSYKMENVPEFEVCNNYLVTEANPLYIEDTNTVHRYYVYAKGGIKSSYESPAEAIIEADNEQGVVIDSNNQVIWERGGRYNSHIISGINNVPASGDINSMEACAYMLLDAIHVSADINDIKGKGMSIIDIISKYTDTGVNLTGCTFDEILYYVSGDRPVIAMKDKSHAVIITAYTPNSVTIYDPVTGSSSVMLHSSASSMFESAGNIYVSAAR